MKGVVAALAALLLPALPGAARQQQQQQNDPVEQRVQRLREQLQLTEAQVAKVREIYKKQYDDVRGVLTEEQRRRYDETGRGPGGGAPGGTQGRGGGRPTGGLPRIDDLKTQANLSEDQVTKVEAILNAYREETRNFLRNRGGGGGGNPQDFQAQFQKARDTAAGKIREVLNADQRTKFDALLNAAPTFGNRGAGTGGAGGGGRGGSIDERVNGALLALRIEDAKEADAIKGVIKKVIELMEKVETYQRESRTKLEAASRATDLTDAVVGERIEELRKGQRDLEKELNTARRELMAIVTNRQELELVRRGILK